MTIEVKITSNFHGLDKIKNGLKKKGAGVKVGILGNTNTRIDGEPLGNAGIGLIQEFGSISKNIPPRSFLRMPLETKSKELAASLNNVGTRKKLLNGDIVGIMMDIGHTAEQIINDAFISRGFGNWKPNAPATIDKKGSSAPLIDTGELRRSITSKVVENG